MSNLEQENTKLKLEIVTLQKEIDLLKNRLSKYSNPDRNKKYYQTHKEELKKRNYKQTPPTKEQKKIYNKKYYEKKKLEKQKDIIIIN